MLRDAEQKGRWGSGDPLAVMHLAGPFGLGSVGVPIGCTAAWVNGSPNGFNQFAGGRISVVKTAVVRAPWKVTAVVHQLR